MKLAHLVAAALVASLLAGCSFQNKYEREADRITRAVMNNDLKPVAGDISPRVKITRVEIAAISDELSEQGKLLSIKESTANCPAGVHCFVVKFEKHDYRETMRLDESGKVVEWRIKMAPSPTGG